MEAHQTSYLRAMGRFDGRVALVSGAASGIGAAVATRLAEEGGTVVGSDLVAIDGSRGTVGSMSW
jgi:3-oxoacyl-ACP reductase-like protein